MIRHFCNFSHAVEHIITLLGNGMKVKYYPILFPKHVKWIPCHHGMVHPQVMAGDSPQIWWVAANIYNNQMRTADPPAWGLGMGLTTPHNKLFCYKTTKDKTDDAKDSFCEELECVFNTFPKHHMKILL
jgi:hypothetical protein